MGDVGTYSFYMVDTSMVSRTSPPYKTAEEDLGITAVHQGVVAALGELGYIQQVIEPTLEGLIEGPYEPKSHHWLVTARSVEEAELVVRGTPLGHEQLMTVARTLPINQWYVNPEAKETIRQPKPGNVFERLLNKISLQEVDQMLKNNHRLTDCEKIIVLYVFFNWVEMIEEKKMAPDRHANKTENWKKLHEAILACNKEKHALEAVSESYRAAGFSDDVRKRFLTHPEDPQQGISYN